MTETQLGFCQICSYCDEIKQVISENTEGDTLLLAKFYDNFDMKYPVFQKYFKKNKVVDLYTNYSSKRESILSLNKEIIIEKKREWSVVKKRWLGNTIRNSSAFQKQLYHSV